MNYSTGNTRSNALSAALQGAGASLPTSRPQHQGRPQQRPQQRRKPPVRLDLFNALPPGAWFRLFNLVKHTKDYSTTVLELPLNVKEFVQNAQIDLVEVGGLYVKSGQGHARLIQQGARTRIGLSHIGIDVVPGPRAVCLWTPGPTGVYTADGKFVKANYYAV